MGSWVSRIPPLSRIVSLGLGLWVTPEGLRAFGTILPAPGHWGEMVVLRCTAVCAAWGAVFVYMCVRGRRCWPGPRLQGS